MIHKFHSFGVTWLNSLQLKTFFTLLTSSRHRKTNPESSNPNFCYKICFLFWFAFIFTWKSKEIKNANKSQVLTLSNIFKFNTTHSFLWKIYILIRRSRIPCLISWARYILFHWKAIANLFLVTWNDYSVQSWTQNLPFFSQNFLYFFSEM